MNLNRAKELMSSGVSTCMILDKDDVVFESNYRGVKPLLDFMDKKYLGNRLILIDKIIGKGAAMLAHLIGIKEIYTPIISEDGYNYITNYTDIQLECDKRVPFIINRAGDGMCPVENSLKDINESSEALETIHKTLEKLKKSQ